MTEAEWLACEDPMPMLAFAFELMSQRKLRLFAVAAARLVWGLLAGARSREAVETAERFADGEATDDELAAAADAADEAQFEIWQQAGGSNRHPDYPEEWHAALWAVWAAG